MMMLRLFSAGRLLLLALLAWSALPARVSYGQAADASCDAVERTETLRAEGHYRQARTRLLECVNAQCGGDVRRRCAATLQKLDAVTPSIVVRATDGRGNDVTDVAVSLEDEPLVSSLDGMAIPVDPGTHRFTFRRAGFEPVIETITIRQGEKFRSVDVQIGPLEPSPAIANAESGPSMSLSSTRLAAGASLLGVGAVGLGAFTWLGLKARSEEKDLEPCRPGCPDKQVDSVRSRYVLANVSLGVGIAALGAGAWVLLTGSSSTDVAQPADGGIAIVADSDGARAAFSGRF